MFKKPFLKKVSSDNLKAVLTNLLKTFYSKSEILLRKVKKIFRKCSSSYVQCSSWKTCETIHSKLEKKLYKERKLFQSISLLNYSKVPVEWKFGILYKTVSPKPERYARTFQELLEHFVRLAIYNASFTIYRKVQYKHNFFWKKTTQECSIEHVIYSFNDCVEKLLRRIEKLSGWTPTLFSGEVIHFI